MKIDMQAGYLSLVQLFLPEFILEHFELKAAREEGGVFHLDLEEVNAPPEDLISEKLLSKGFFPTITVQDFPIRGRKVFMHIKRRRWLRVSTGATVYSSITLGQILKIA